MRPATKQVEGRSPPWSAGSTPVRHRVARRRLVAAVGQPMVADAIRRYRAGEAIGPEPAAWLTVALRELRVRDDAWARMLPEHNAEHTRLWADLTRLAPPGYVAAPASLLAFVAWQAGDGALANIALDRALADDQRYSMARLLRRALDSRRAAVGCPAADDPGGGGRHLRRPGGGGGRRSGRGRRGGIDADASPQVRQRGAD